MTNTPLSRRSARRQRGAALVAALLFTVVSAALIGVCLLVSSTSYSLSWTQSRSESALLLAEAGINDELVNIAKSVNSATVAGMSSQPTVSVGETKVYPGENHVIYGRKGTVTGQSEGNYWVCSTNNEWWKSGATPIPWDGKSSTFWITATGFVNGAWRRVEVKASTVSIFGLYAVYAMASYGNNSNAVVLSAGDVIVNGIAGTNGQIANSNGSSFQASGIINANTVDNPTGQFDSRHMAPGASFYTQRGPFVYPTTVNVLKRTFGIDSYSDAAAWTWLSNNHNNASGVYTYRGSATSSTLSAANCARMSFSGTVLSNKNTNVWSSAAVKPGTSSKVKTIIFEPGDYYFTTVDIGYDAGTELVIDPQALASGGTPGQVRFWIYEAGSNQGDLIAVPIVATKPPGSMSADPSMFRIYYGKDGKTFTFERPSNTKDYTGSPLLGDFNVYGGVYAVTKPPRDTSSQLVGTLIDFNGSTGTGGGRVVLNGSLLADKVAFHGAGTVNFLTSNGPSDPPAGAGISGGYSD
ncbi:hypothetical protein EON82_09195 [bacterium]|nr:MAG: hypothetical protein EON82_09195 [bacterium]